MNDTERAERIRQELEFVNDELSAAVGRNGRDHKMSDPAERIRLRIGKAIRSALSGIREHDPSLAHHLTTCIRTGYSCGYLPDPRRPMTWKFKRLTAPTERHQPGTRSNIVRLPAFRF